MSNTTRVWVSSLIRAAISGMLPVITEIVTDAEHSEHLWTGAMAFKVLVSSLLGILLYLERSPLPPGDDSPPPGTPPPAVSGATFRAVAAAMLLALPLGAVTVTGPVQYANGANATGFIRVEWPAFVTSTSVSVAAGMITAPVNSGVFSLNLQPTDGATPTGTRYKATYLLDSAPSAIEYWNVPVSATAVSIASIRLNPLSFLGHWQAGFIDAETPSGTINGSNAAFTLTKTPNPVGSLVLAVDGVIKKQGTGYTISGAAITFQGGHIPTGGQTIQAWYRWNVSNVPGQVDANKIQGRDISATAPMTGQVLVWNGTQYAPADQSGGGGGGAVSSVFGRTGPVVAATGDYSFPQISGTIATGQIPSAAGDVTGAYSALSVERIRGRTVHTTAPTDGQVYKYVSANSRWEPANDNNTDAVTTVHGRTGAVVSATNDYAFSQLSGQATGTQVRMVHQEVPSGTVNGSNAAFTLTNAPSPVLSLDVYRNGMFMRPTIDYNLSGSTITFVGGAIPQTGDTLAAKYWY